MAQITLAGKPAIRYPDPLVQRVNPDGNQPYTAYQAALVFLNEAGEYDQLLRQPPDSILAQLLLFGADYPVKIGGAQIFEQQVYDSAGTLVPIQDLIFPILPPNGTALADAVPNILPTVSFNQYKKIATGSTATNGVSVSGYPAYAFVSGHTLFASEEGDGGDRASFGVSLDVTLNGAVIDGPGNYNAIVTTSTNALINVILYEPNLTQAIVDNNYIIENVIIAGGSAATLNVVGLWTVAGYTPPSPPRFAPFSVGPTSLTIQERIAAAVAALR